ncbi:MAG: hypothetical protein AAF721_21395 [Myxococcota bacterium]
MLGQTAALVLVLSLGPAPDADVAPKPGVDAGQEVPEAEAEPGEHPAQGDPEPEPGTHPAQEDPEAEPGSAEEISAGPDPELPREPAPDPFAKVTPPGFPDFVDLNDESTWVELEVAQKDELRAIRARSLAAAAEGRESAPKPSPPADTSSEAREALGPPRPARRDQERIAWWEERDARLVNLTLGFGITWGLSSILTAIILGVHFNTIDKCEQAATTLATPDLDRCAGSARRSSKLAIPGYLMATVASGSMIGTIVSGAILGGHRNTRAFVLTPVAGRRVVGVGLRRRF